MIKTPAEFGSLVRTKRKENGWTQAELARRCGTGERFILDLENGKPSCQIGKALLAAREVGIDLVDASEIAPRKPSPSGDEDDLSFVPKF